MRVKVINEDSFTIEDLSLMEIASVHFATWNCPVKVEHSCTRVADMLSKLFSEELHVQKTEGEE